MYLGILMPLFEVNEFPKCNEGKYVNQNLVLKTMEQVLNNFFTSIFSSVSFG